jgi:cell division protein FtsL
MGKFNILLLALLVVCALGLVTSQDRQRKIFMSLEKAQEQTRQLDTHTAQLELEQSSLAKSSLVDTKARRNLAMQPVTNERTLHLNVGGEVERTAMQGSENKAKR